MSSASNEGQDEVGEHRRNWKISRHFRVEASHLLAVGTARASAHGFTDCQSARPCAVGALKTMFSMKWGSLRRMIRPRSVPSQIPRKRTHMRHLLVTITRPSAVRLLDIACGWFMLHCGTRAAGTRLDEVVFQFAVDDRNQRKRLRSRSPSPRLLNGFAGRSGPQLETPMSKRR